MDENCHDKCHVFCGLLHHTEGEKGKVQHGESQGCPSLLGKIASLSLKMPLKILPGICKKT